MLQLQGPACKRRSVQLIYIFLITVYCNLTSLKYNYIVKHDLHDSNVYVPEHIFYDAITEIINAIQGGSLNMNLGTYYTINNSCVYHETGYTNIPTTNICHNDRMRRNTIS